MYKGMREEFFKVAGHGREKSIVEALNYMASRMQQGSMQFSSLWTSAMGLIMPDLNNVNMSGPGGNIKVNRVYSSEPANIFRNLARFLLGITFPENTPHFRGVFRDADTRNVIGPEEMSNSLAAYGAQASETCRDILREGGFYEAAEEALIHYTILGCAPIYPVFSRESLDFIHRPIYETPWLLSKNKQPVGVVLYDSYDEWEALREWGKEGLRMLTQTIPVTAQSLKYHYNSLPASQSWPGAYQSGGMDTIGPQDKHNLRVKHILIPNNPYMGILETPFYPEMEYIGFQVSEKTQRILDVELYPVKPFGVARDIFISSEAYPRGVGSQVLADVAVLNKKKKNEYISDSLNSNSPIVTEGEGFSEPIRNIQPGAILPMRDGSKATRLYDNSSQWSRTRAIYEGELEGLRQGTNSDKMLLQETKRQTAEEYRQQQDTAWGLFQSTNNRLWRHLGKPILRAVYNYALVTKRLPKPPDEILDGRVLPEFEGISIFSYSSATALGQQLVRALQPIAAFAEKNPSVLDSVHFEKFIKANMAGHDLGQYLKSDEGIRETREQRAQAIAAAMPTKHTQHLSLIHI